MTDKKFVDRKLVKDKHPIVIVEKDNEISSIIAEELELQNFQIILVSQNNFSQEYLNFKGSCLFILSIDDETTRSVLASLHKSNTNIDAMLITENDPNDYVSFIFETGFGIVITKDSLKELANNTINAFFAEKPRDIFSIPSILKGKYTLDTRKYERRRNGKVVIQHGDQDRRGDERRKNRVIPIGDIVEFGSDTLAVREKIIDTVMTFFEENGLGFLKEEPRIEIGIDELVTNILRHAYNKGEEKLAQIILVNDERKGKLIFFIQDYKGKLSKEVFLEEMARVYDKSRIKSGADLGVDGTGFRFVRNCCDLFIVNILEGDLTRFILFYDIEKMRLQQEEDTIENDYKNLMIFHFN